MTAILRVQSSLQPCILMKLKLNYLVNVGLYYNYVAHVFVFVSGNMQHRDMLL